jgi:predicted nucleotidyltransferase
VGTILLFGSFARGDWSPDSDVDLLVVVSHINVPTLERAGVFRPYFQSIPLDVNPMVVTREELDRARDDPASVVHAALAEGRVLFDRTSA